MARKFIVEPGPHSRPDHTQWAIQSGDLSKEECQLLRYIVCCNRLDSPHYKASQEAHPFLQCYQEPFYNEADGYVLIEFWTADRTKIDNFVNHINETFEKERP